MHPLTLKRAKVSLALATGLVLVATLLTAIAASANTAGTGVVINEAYLNGGSAGATYLNKFIELYNPTDAPIDLSSMSLQYRSATGTVNPTGVAALTGSIAAHGHYLVQGSSNAANGAALPTPDATFGASFAGGGGTLFLASQTTALTAPPTGSVTGTSGIVDLLGYGTSNTFETAPASAASVSTSLGRTNAADSESNAADFTAGAPTPQNAASDGGATTGPTPTPTPTPTPPAPTAPVTIAAIQGTTDTSPLVGQTVTTRGYVTASYPTGGLNGYYIQTAGTGGGIDLASHTASDALFVFSSATVAQATVGSYVEVTGSVSEFAGLTELSVAAGGLRTLSGTDAPGSVAPAPAALVLPTDAAKRETLEGMLLAPQGDYTVTDNYDTNFYGSIVLAEGATPLQTPTAVVEPGSADYTALVASNLARSVTLDDGSSLNFNTAANKATPLPYLSVANPVRIGAATTFTKPVVLDYRFGTWNLQPTSQLTAANAAAVQPATFANTRTASPDDVGGDITLASFNVLNYFTTTGDSITGCTYYTDRDGNPNTVNSGCDARGAANADDLARQQAKIVSAINGLSADVVSLEEIENSARFGKNRDTALAALVAALNSAAGAGTWAFVPSPAVLPASEDVIRTAFIYRPALVRTVGESVILDDPAFANARQPLAQAFQLAALKAGSDAAASSSFLAIVNHFKSKGSGSGADADQGDGQGASTLSRVNQAKALVAFADAQKAATKIDRVLLSGDFNAYLKEDPIDVITAAGYTDLGSTTGKSTYAFDGAVGSLDHIFASTGAKAAVNDVDVWNINSVESIALEYSRFNYNATDFFQPNAFRSSDHDPILVGLKLAPAPTDPGTPVPPKWAAQLLYELLLALIKALFGPHHH
ncbi:ExeM/NucH family extracellular endonuclease [Subtercola boreus]|uniref:ExeM/NucH family extracellular endonuclease n=1 Tax=Subtercola boreus TaxID=120213 RepID=UPI000E2EE8A0|nr:ExeM/NucH family extracellular endonuclease [Subtercola boreus]